LLVGCGLGLVVPVFTQVTYQKVIERQTLEISVKEENLVSKGVPKAYA
jgi:hypothetical protein